MLILFTVSLLETLAKKLLGQEREARLLSVEETWKERWQRPQIRPVYI